MHGLFTHVISLCVICSKSMLDMSRLSNEMHGIINDIPE